MCRQLEFHPTGPARGEVTVMHCPVGLGLVVERRSGPQGGGTGMCRGRPEVVDQDRDDARGLGPVPPGGSR